MKSCPGLFLLTLIFAAFSLRGAIDPVPLHWLDGQPPDHAVGVSWGVPWPKGAVPKDQAFVLTTGDGKPLPLQTWPLGILAGWLREMERFRDSRGKGRHDISPGCSGCGRARRHR